MILEHMPPGEYEFWPVGKRDDRRLIAAGQPPAMRMTAVVGENLAVLTFKPSE
jgi:hypothetical protein